MRLTLDIRTSGTTASRPRPDSLLVQSRLNILSAPSERKASRYTRKQFPPPVCPPFAPATSYCGNGAAFTKLMTPPPARGDFIAVGFSSRGLSIP